jgi:two-component system, cell cycle response regulator
MKGVPSQINCSTAALATLNFSRILIASEDPATADFLDHNLREWGYVPVQAADGLAAVRLLTGPNAPRIAILDAALSRLSGEEVSAKLLKSNGNKAIWTLMLCDHVDASTMADATDAGVDDLILKPIDATDLRIRVGVAGRVQALMSQLDSQTSAATFHASHDKLTGLLNRDALLRLLFAETDRAQRLKTPLTLVVLDLDYFSRINIDYGYEAGDKILQELAKRFRRYLRSYDLIGRCGEDEFLIALPGCTSDEAYALAQRLKRSILHRPFSVGGDVLTLTASVGISHSHGRSPLLVLREAERAMAGAKLGGRNCERQYSQLEAQQAQRSAKPALAFVPRKQ